MIMHEAYKLIIVNLLLSSLLILGVFIYKYIYPKKKINLFYLLLLVSILPVISVFRPGVYESGDFNIHIYRAIDFFNSLSQNILIPTWAGNLNATYGYPLFIFNYSLPYYALSFVHFFGIGFIFAMKIILASSFVLSGVFMFLFIKDYLKDEKAAFISAIFYLFAPYHLVDEHFKVALGELFIFTVLPLLFLFEFKLFKKTNIIYFLLSSISIALLVMSHAVLAFFSILLLFAYILYQATNEKKYKAGLINLLSIAFGLLMSSFTWISPFLLKQYTFIQSHPLQTVAFPGFSDLLYSPWRFGFLFQGPEGQISEIIGYTQIFVLFIILTLIIKKKVSKKYFYDLVFWILSIFILLFLMSSISKPIWYLLPFITGAGGHRLLIILVFIVSILSGYLTIHFKKRTIFILALVFITIAYTILNWGQRRLISETTDATLAANLPKSTASGEGHFYAATIWVNPNNLWFSSIPRQHLEILKGKGEIKPLQRSSIYHSYIISSSSPIKARENTLYFPSWTVTDNGRDIKSFPDSKGIIEFNLPKGTSKVELKYNDIFAVYLLKLISEITIFLSFTFLLIFYLKSLIRKA